MAEKKKRKAEERSPPKVPPQKSEAEMPKKKKDKDKPARGNKSFAIGGKGPQKSISAAPTRAQKFQHEGGYDRDVETMQRIFGDALQRDRGSPGNALQGVPVGGTQVQARAPVGPAAAHQCAGPERAKRAEMRNQERPVGCSSP